LKPAGFAGFGRPF